MAAKKPTTAQAQLQLQLYDLRREPRLREAREWFLRTYTPENAQQVAPPGSEGNTFARMVISYWDQACLMVEYGLLHEEFFFLSSNEFWMVWERIQPNIGLIREALHNKHTFEALEKVSKRYAKWAERRSPGFLAAVSGYFRAASAGHK